MPMLTAMSSRGQVVLPKKVRLDLNLTEGTQFIVLSDGGNILLKPVKTPSLSEFAGLLDKARAWAKRVSDHICDQVFLSLGSQKEVR